jgi:hypothetical protein
MRFLNFFNNIFYLLEERDSGSGGTSRDAATHQARVHDDLHYISSLFHLFKARRPSRNVLHYI